MNREQIIQMARDAGLDVETKPDGTPYGMIGRSTLDDLECFYNIVRAATKEEDAKICEELDSYEEDNPGESFANAIRASK